MGWNPFAKKDPQAAELDRWAESMGRDYELAVDQLIVAQHITDRAKEKLNRKLALTYYENVMALRIGPDKIHVGRLDDEQWGILLKSMLDQHAELQKSEPKLRDANAAFARLGAEHARRLARGFLGRSK